MPPFFSRIREILVKIEEQTRIELNGRTQSELFTEIGRIIAPG